RSIGARSFTTLPSMLISPEVMSSRPATMRSVVVLPQPDGPTSTTNSWSRISRFTSLTAWVPSNFLFRSLRSTSAITWSPPCKGGKRALRAGSWCREKWGPSLFLVSAFDAAGHAGDVVLDEERVNERHRDRAEQRTGHQRAPVEH